MSDDNQQPNLGGKTQGDEVLPPSQTWNYHPDREAVISEPHARPHLPVSSDDIILHLGFQVEGSDLTSILKKLSPTLMEANRRHYVKAFDQVSVKLEQHTEFVSLTCLCAKHKQDRISELLASLLGDVQVHVIAMTKLYMCQSAEEANSYLPTNHSVYGGVMRGQINVSSSLMPDIEGYIAYVVQSETTEEHDSNELGRRIQRLLDMETYRTMCLLGLPMARRASQRLEELEEEVKKIAAQINVEATDDLHAMFDRVAQCSQDCNSLHADTGFRYAASRAYYDLAQQRLDSLEEFKAGSLQSISGFVRSRLSPGMATIDSVAKRQSTLSTDINNALSLLRTRIDLNLAQDNQDLLKSMDARHRQQVIIAQTVEGLSAVAITYYSIGLLAYMIKGAKDWLPVTPGVGIALSVPLVLISVWSFLHIKRTKWERESSDR